MTGRDLVISLVIVLVLMAVFVIWGCSPALINARCPDCPQLPPPPPPVVCPGPSMSVPPFPELPKVSRLTSKDTPAVCYDQLNFELLVKRMSLLMCDDCTLRRRLQADVPAECDNHPECF